MRLTPAAGKLSTSAGVVQSKEPAVCCDLPPLTQPASETNSPAALRTVAKQTMPNGFKTLASAF